MCTPRYATLMPLLSSAQYASDYDTMYVPKEIIAKEVINCKGKVIIKAYEQLCGMALLFNANRNLLGKG